MENSVFAGRNDAGTGIPGYMETVRERLSQRLSEFDVRDIVASEKGNIRFYDCLCQLIDDPDDAVGFAALRVLCSSPTDCLLGLSDRSDEFVDRLLAEANVGKRRLLLSLLYKLPVSEAYRRVDFMDFCISGINSSEPVAIRALCLKHSHALSRRYPWLEDELRAAIALLKSESLAPALKSVLRQMK